MLQPKIPKYPFKRVGLAARPMQRDWHIMTSAEIDAGPGLKSHMPPQRILEIQKDASITEIPAYRSVPPKWVLARIARHVSVKVVCEDLITRLRRAPSKRAYLETQLGFNELGRRRGGGKLLRRFITQDLVDEFIKKGG
jgi:hypothetical protein